MQYLILNRAAFAG